MGEKVAQEVRGKSEIGIFASTNVGRAQTFDFGGGGIPVSMGGGVNTGASEILGNGWDRGYGPPEDSKDATDALQRALRILDLIYDDNGNKIASPNGENGIADDDVRNLFGRLSEFIQKRNNDEGNLQIGELAQKLNYFTLDIGVNSGDALAGGALFGRRLADELPDSAFYKGLQFMKDLRDAENPSGVQLFPAGHDAAFAFVAQERGLDRAIGYSAAANGMAIWDGAANGLKAIWETAKMFGDIATIATLPGSALAISAQQRMEQRWDAMTWENIGGPAARGVDAALLYNDFRPFLRGVSETAFGLFAPAALARAMTKTPDGPEIVVTGTGKLDKLIAKFANASGKTETKLANKLAKAFTRGSGDRVVLGEWVENGKSLGASKGGYLGEATENGGIYFETSDTFFAKLKGIVGEDFADAKALKINEAFLKQQLENGVNSFDFTQGGLDKARSRIPGAVGAEYVYLLEHAPRFGYIWNGKSWIKH